MSCFCLLQSVLRRRDAIQMEYDMLREELCRKKDDSSEVCVVLLSGKWIPVGDPYQHGRNSTSHWLKAPRPCPEPLVGLIDVGIWYGKCLAVYRSWLTVLLTCLEKLSAANLLCWCTCVQTLEWCISGVMVSQSWRSKRLMCRVWMLALECDLVFREPGPT